MPTEQDRERYIKYSLISYTIFQRHVRLTTPIEGRIDRFILLIFSLNRSALSIGAIDRLNPQKNVTDPRCPVPRTRLLTAPGKNLGRWQPDAKESAMRKGNTYEVYIIIDILYTYNNTDSFPLLADRVDTG